MKTILFAAAGVLALTLPVQAQKMGSTNTNAPMVGQSIETKAGSVEIKYHAIIWGRTVEMLADKERGERARQRINNSPEPMGSFKASSDVTLGGQNVAAGDYKLFFSITNDLKWNVKLVGASTVEIPLELKDSGHDHKRLTISLAAAEADNAAKLYVAFGKQGGSIDVKMGGNGAKKAEPAAGEKKGDGMGKQQDPAPMAAQQRARTGTFFEVLTGAF